MRNAHVCTIAVLVVILQLAVGMSHTDATTSAILIYDHGFAKSAMWARSGNLILTNRTSSFTQDDKSVIAWVQAAFYGANLTWKWYDPNGQLYANDTREWQCINSPCFASDVLQITGNQIETRIGRWRLDLFNDDSKLYSDYFYMNPVVTQVNHWSFSVDSSTSGIVHGDLTVTIQPNNGSWSYYRMYMPYAVNLTAFELGSNMSLTVKKSSSSLVVVSLGGPRSSGYSFVIDFDVRYALTSLNGWDGGAFMIAWQDQPWQRFGDVHPIYETFNITLPQGAGMLDVIGINDLNLKYEVETGDRESIGFDTTIINEPFGWTMIYRDLAYSKAHPNRVSSTADVLNPNSGPRLPLLPLTLSGLSIWSAVMSVFLLTASELASPMYERSGSMVLINRRRLRFAAIMLVAVFVASTASQFIFQYSAAVPR